MVEVRTEARGAALPRSSPADQNLKGDMNGDSKNTEERVAETKGQMRLWPGGPVHADYRTGTCPECGLMKTRTELATGFWGFCRDCEEARIQDVCAG